MQFNITFKTIFEYVLKKLVLCIQIRFVSTEKTTRIASRASCYYSDALIRQPGELGYHNNNIRFIIPYWLCSTRLTIKVFIW